jgi:hypothetical protein
MVVDQVLGLENGGYGDLLQVGSCVVVTRQADTDL